MNRQWMAVGIASVAMTLTACGSRCKEAEEKIIQPVENVVTYLNTQPDGEALAKEGCGGILGNFEGLQEGAETIRELARAEFVDSYSTCAAYQTSFRLDCSGWYNDYYWYYEIFDTDLVSEANADESIVAEETVAAGASSQEQEIDMDALDASLAQTRPATGGVTRGGSTPSYRPGSRPIRVYPGRRYPYPGRPIPVCRHVAYTYCAVWQHHTNVDEPKYTQAMDLARDLELVLVKSNEMCQLAYASKFDEAKAKAQELNQFLVSQVKPNGQMVYANSCQ